MSRFVLIDGNALVHRAFHALPPLSKNGEMVNAVYGFFSMLLKILEDVKPEYLAVAFDRAAPNFRQALFVGYQQHRPKMADDLSSQFVLIHKILEKANVAIFEVDGYEADDVIGTIASQSIQNSKFRIHNLEVIIVSGDRDLLQLVNHRVRMLAPVVGITNMVIFDSAKVKEKYGLEPSQIIDYKALVGDASDGYPGVSGVGPKTASNLLNKYKTFENIYKHLDELSQRLATAMASDIEQASLAKKLATIETNVPIQVDIKKCSMNTFDWEALKREFKKREFSSLLKRLGSAEVEKVEQVEEEANKKRKKPTLSDQLGLL